MRAGHYFEVTPALRRTPSPYSMIVRKQGIASRAWKFEIALYGALAERADLEFLGLISESFSF